MLYSSLLFTTLHYSSLLFTQIPFSSWLPAAIAAPTPVSSLVHSSTLVTAGVYLLIRFENLFKNNNKFICWFLMISLLTIFISGFNAHFEYDLKKIIALSTLRQLGLIIRILFLGFRKLAFFHLLTHALFKALLFIYAGIYIHNLNNFQDIRFIGSLRIHMPLVSVCFNFANLSLCGFPFLAVFYSKDLILELVIFQDYNIFIIFIFLISTLFTVIYTFRLIYFTIFNSFIILSLNSLKEEGKKSISWILNKSLFGLIVIIIFIGRVFSWVLFPYPLIIFLPFYFKIIPIIIIIIGIILRNKFFYLQLNINFIMLYFLKIFLGMIWFLPIISTRGLIKHFLLPRRNLSLSVDQNWTEYYIGRGVFKLLKIYSSWIDLLFFYLNSILNLFFIVILIWCYIFICSLFFFCVPLGVTILLLHCFPP